MAITIFHHQHIVHLTSGRLSACQESRVKTKRWLSQPQKTYNSGDSLVVTHLTTNPPVHCLSTAERTGSSIFSVLWSYVLSYCHKLLYIVNLEAIFLLLDLLNYSVSHLQLVIVSLDMYLIGT